MPLSRSRAHATARWRHLLLDHANYELLAPVLTLGASTGAKGEPIEQPGIYLAAFLVHWRGTWCSRRRRLKNV
jgi:hypothetical protein